MVLSAYAQSMPVSDENVSSTSHASKGSIDDTHTRRQRYRFQHNNTMLGNSHQNMAREAARRMNHAAAPVVVSSSRVIDLAGMLEDIGLDDDESSMPKLRRTTTTTTTPTSPVAFSRYLRRPAFRSVSNAAIEAIAPELANISVEFIQKKIRDMGDENTEINCPKGRLPRELPVITNNVSTSPTHLIAAYSRPNMMKKQCICIHAVHALVIAANCANFPPLPYSKPETSPGYPGSASSTVSLPVIPLSLQNPEAFPILIEYLYTRRTDTLLRSLLPISLPPTYHLVPNEDLAKFLATTCSSMTLRIHLQRVYAFWTTVTALGVFDEKLWKTMEAAWEVLHVAQACL